MIEGFHKGTRLIVFDSLVLSEKKLFSSSGQRWRPGSITSALELLIVIQYMCLNFLFCRHICVP